MIVCLCKDVSERQVREQIAGGASCMDIVGRACGAGTDCGCCRDEIASILRERGCATSRFSRTGAFALAIAAS